MHIPGFSGIQTCTQLYRLEDWVLLKKGLSAEECDATKAI